MHPVLQYILAFIVVVLIGVLSGGFVLLISKLLRLSGAGREMTFGLAGLLGLTAFGAGQIIDSRWLVGIGVLLFGWVVLPILTIPLLVLWRLGAWCFRWLVT